MDQLNLFSTVQSAYLHKHSMETALLKIQNDIIMALDSRNRVSLVLFSLSAALDTIDHEILVSRLQTRFGIQGPTLQWFWSYLVDHYQVTHVTGEISDPLCLIYGVPQGSVLGTLQCITYTCSIYDIVHTPVC